MRITDKDLKSETRGTVVEGKVFKTTTVKLSLETYEIPNLKKEGVIDLSDLFPQQQGAIRKAKIRATILEDLPISAIYLADLVKCLSLILDISELKQVSKILSSLGPRMLPVAVTVPLGFSFHGNFEITNLSFKSPSPAIFEIPDTYVLQTGQAYSSVRVEKAVQEVADEGSISEPAIYQTHVSNLVTDANYEDLST